MSGSTDELMKGDVVIMKEKEIIKVVSAAIAISTFGIIMSVTMPKKELHSIKLPGKKPDRVAFRSRDNAVDDEEVEDI